MAYRYRSQQMWTLHGSSRAWRLTEYWQSARRCSHPSTVATTARHCDVARRYSVRPSVYRRLLNSSLAYQCSVMTLHDSREDFICPSMLAQCSNLMTSPSRWLLDAAVVTVYSARPGERQLGVQWSRLCRQCSISWRILLSLRIMTVPLPVQFQTALGLTLSAVARNPSLAVTSKCHSHFTPVWKLVCRLWCTYTLVSCRDVDLFLLFFLTSLTYWWYTYM